MRRARRASVVLDGRRGLEPARHGAAGGVQQGVGRPRRPTRIGTVRAVREHGEAQASVVSTADEVGTSNAGDLALRSVGRPRRPTGWNLIDSSYELNVQQASVVQTADEDWNMAVPPACAAAVASVVLDGRRGWNASLNAVSSGTASVVLDGRRGLERDRRGRGPAPGSRSVVLDGRRGLNVAYWHGYSVQLAASVVLDGRRDWNAKAYAKLENVDGVGRPRRPTRIERRGLRDGRRNGASVVLDGRRD